MWPRARTPADLFAAFLSDHAEKVKKASSVSNDRRLIEMKLGPALGKRKVAEVTRGEIAKLHSAMSKTPYEANRCLALLSKAFNLAEVWGWRPDGTNPCRHVQRFAETKRKRLLAPAELARLGETLRIAERDGCLTLPPREGAREKAERVPVSRWAVAAIRLLILTGARKSEILGLRWAWVDAESRRANLPDSKTGEKTIILPPAALEVLAGLPRDDGTPTSSKAGNQGLIW